MKTSQVGAVFFEFYTFILTEISTFREFLCVKVVFNSTNFSQTPQQGEVLYIL